MSGALRIVSLVAFTLVVGTVAFAYPVIDRQWEWLGVTWQYPHMLWLLLLVPFVYWRGTYGEDERTPRLRMGTVAPLLAGPRGVRAWLRDLPGVVRAFAIALMALAMARPVSTTRPDVENESGIDIVLVLDLSGSMRAVFDAPPGAPHLSVGKRATRLDTAKDVIRDFISRRKTDRIGVVVFGKSAFVLSPPTLDYHLLDLLVEKMSLDVIDGTGTAIGDAVGVATARLRRSDARSKTIVLLTDGDSNAGSIAPEYAGHLATVVGAKIYTIQIGNGDEVEVQNGLDLFGQPHYTRARFPVNPELLKKLAGATGGESYVATDAQALTASMHDVLNRLEKTRFEASTASFEDLFPLLLLPGVALIALDALLRAWVMRRFP
ncbi:MAG TPA: VWA domain-containing protein [Polyangiaceae bacterium]|nr:VWA domain-containing protein [Polyangiaceae bacterium]